MDTAGHMGVEREQGNKNKRINNRSINCDNKIETSSECFECSIVGLVCKAFTTLSWFSFGADMGEFGSLLFFLLYCEYPKYCPQISIEGAKDGHHSPTTHKIGNRLGRWATPWVINRFMILP